MLLAAWLPSRLAAQMTLPGRVLELRGSDSLPVPGARVLLHRISRERQGPVDSATTDRAGRFTFRVARPDTTAIYTTSTEFAGIGYFGEPVPPRQPVDQLLVVYDTTSAGPPLGIGIRHFVIARPDAGGNRRILDIVQVVNATGRTRIARDTLTPVWAMIVPPGLTNAVLGQSDVASSSVTFDSLRMLVMAPIEPGAKQLAVSYALPRRPKRFTIPVDQPTERFELLVEDSTATVPGMASAEPIDLDGRAFRRFTLDSLAAGREITVEFGGGPGTARLLMWVAVAVAGVALLYGLRLATVRPARTPAAGTASSQGKDALLAQVVALDERYAGREAEVPADEWEAYRKRRETLKRELARHLPT